jgi:DNA-damage-inducible protein J
VQNLFLPLQHEFQALVTKYRERVDELEKLECESIFKSLGITTSEAVRLFIRQVNIVKGLPFELKLSGSAAEHDLRFRNKVESVLAKMDQPGRVSAIHGDVGARLKAKQAAQVCY